MLNIYYKYICMINIQGCKSIDDPFYRYQMEPVKLTYQTNKTVFLNIKIICTNLDRSQECILKFLKSYFGISIENKNNIVTMTKHIEQKDMQNAIYKFIDDYVLCKKCANPETYIENKRKKNIMICKACCHKIEI